MFTPSGPNRPTPHRPRGDDDWVAVLVALGTLGGLTGWLMVGGFPTLDAGSKRAAISSVEQTVPTDEADANEEVTQDGAVSLPGTPDRDRAAVEAEGQSALSPTEGEPILPDAGERSPSPAVPAPDALTVPDPQIPDSDRAESLPVVRPPLAFADVPEGDWAKPYIDALTARGVLNGLPEGIFEPNRSMTRAEFAAQVANAFDLEPVRVNKAFSDVSTDYWGATPIQKAVTTGFMTGYPEGDFRPNEMLSRVQVVIALATGLSLPEPTDTASLLQTYQDQSEIPDWAEDSVAAAIAAGILAASPASENRLRPNEAASRAEVAVLIYRALAYMGQVEPIE